MLSGLDTRSTTFMALKEWALKEIEEQRNTLEIKDDERARGRIEAYRALLALETASSKPVIAPRALRADQTL